MGSNPNTNLPCWSATFKLMMGWTSDGTRNCTIMQKQTPQDKTKCLHTFKRKEANINSK